MLPLRTLNRLCSAAASASALAVLALTACSADMGDTSPGKKPPGAAKPPGMTAAGTPTPGTPDPGVKPADPSKPPPPPFEALPTQVNAAKVKNLLTGLALTDADLATVTAKPDALKDLVGQWIETAEWKGKMLGFFRQAFQQTQTDPNDYDEQLGRTTNPWQPLDRQLFVRSAEDSFARTALALVEEGAPFTETVTTERFMLNLPLMSSYAYMDAAPMNDDATPVPAGQWLLLKYRMTFVRTLELIPFEDSINPASPNFFKFHEPRPYVGVQPGCKEPDIVKGVGALRNAADYLFGGRPGCGQTDSQFTPQDWATWKWVTIRKPKAAEERAVFFDLPKLRQVTELVLSTPRVGFMTTPAFFANWPTNASNSYRVTANQTMIVALGRSFDDRGVTIPIAESADESKHVQPNTVCYACHLTLDPMRDFFKQSYSLGYFEQLSRNDPNNPIPATGTFAVDGTAPTTGNGIKDLARGTAQHPAFAPAWTQKLCQFANSSSCSAADPEFKRVAEVFKKSNFNFKTLTKELFSSPLVTFASKTVSAEAAGVVISIARRESLCAAIDNRHKLTDFCNLRGNSTVMPAQLRQRARNLALSVPGAGYARGDDEPLLPHDPNLFFTSAVENLCTLLSTQLVDAGRDSKYATLRAPEAMTDFVTTLMGIPPSDPRSPGMLAILQEHFKEATATGVTASDALRSTFILACSSPPATSLGL